MRKYILLFLMFLLQPAACNLLPATCPLAIASEETAFVYDSHGKRDPFIPLITKDGRTLTAYSDIISISDVVIEGILFDLKGGSVVIINDIILKQADSISDIVVEKIEKDYVVLSFKGQEYTFNLKE
jgi:hypothetical protein